MTTNNRTPICLHSLFRAGSTYLFNVFRRSSSGYWCYQEPLNEFLLHAATEPERLLEMHEEMARFLRHGKLEKPYFYEFHALAGEVGRLFRKEFSYDQFFLGDSEDISALQAYFTALINGAQGRPMFQCCRSTGRVARMKRECKDGTHIFLWRNPWDQWWSYKVDRYFDRANLLIANSHSAPDFIRKLTDEFGVPHFSSENIWEELEYFTKYRFDARGSYHLFYALWCHAMLEALPHCDVALNIDQLSESESYRVETAKALLCFDIQGLDFSDCQVPMTAYGEEDVAFFQEVEERIHRLLAWHGYREIDIARMKQLRAENRPQLQREVDVSKDIIRDAMRARSLVRQYELEMSLVYKEAESRATEAESRAIEAESRAIEAETRATESKTKIDELIHHCWQWWTTANEIRHELRGVYASRSWRITKPLRLIVHFLHRLRYGVKQVIKALLKPFLAGAVRFVRVRPLLREPALAWVSKHPAVENRLRCFGLAYGQIESQGMACASGHEKKDNSTNGQESSAELSHLTPHARQIYADLKTAIVQRQKEQG